MALLHRRALPWVLTVRGWTGKPQGGLWVAVVIWWLLVFGIIAIMITTTEPVGEADAVQIELLESPGTGDRGWIHTVYLRP
jgi:hypothetical protein